MRIGLMKTFVLALALALAGCSGGSGDDDDGDAGDGDGNSSSVGVVEVDTISPNHGPLGGGTVITITGQGFLLANAQPDSVLVGGVECDTVQLIDDRTMKVETPPGAAAGAVDVIVFNSNGYDSAVGGYSYNPLPTLATVTADNGPAVGGETVTLTGTGFQSLEPGTNLVYFGENQASGVTVASDTSMTVTSPPGEAFSLVDVAVVNDNGLAEKPSAYEYTGSGETIIALARAGSSGCGGCEYAGNPTYFGAPYTAPLATTQLFNVDPVTGAVASITESETWINGLARAPDGTMYGVISNKADPALANYLVTVDIATGAVTPVGPIGVTNGSNPVNTNDIAFVGPVLFGVAWQAGSGGGIHTINTSTGANTGIGGSNLTSSGNGLVFDGTTLYNSNGNGLCQVDTSTGTVENCLPNGRQLHALTMANGEMYGTTYDYWNPEASAVLEVNKSTGASQQVATVPGKVTALATVP